MAVLEIARTCPSTGSTAFVDAPLSGRHQPVTSTVPEGGTGTSVTVAALFGDSIQPRSMSTACPLSVTSGVMTSTPGRPSRVWYFRTTWRAVS